MSVHCQYIKIKMWYNKYMFIQKLYKNGNSVAVTIPKTLLKDLNLKDGSEVVVEKKDDQVVIASKKRMLAKDIDPNFVKTVDQFIDAHYDVLEELSKR